MPESTSGPAESNPPLPEIPECDVTLDDDGVYHLRHKGSGDTATADTLERVTLQGMLLRITAASTAETPFTTGDLR